jgi:hypothetical protein
MTTSGITKSVWTRRGKRAALSGALGLVMVAAFAQGAVRAEDDEDTRSIDQKIIGGFLKGIGLKGGTDPGIDYRERSPLVVPPSRALPPPQASTTDRDPNWPVDPDIKRSKDIAAKRKAGGGSTFDPDTFGNNLSPSELKRGGTTASAGKTTNGTENPDGSTVKPSVLGYFGGLSLFGGVGNKDEVGTFTGEPPRTTLTAPPPGYQTPSPTQPYGVTKSAPEYGKARKAEDIPVGDLGN